MIDPLLEHDALTHARTAAPKQSFANVNELFAVWDQAVSPGNYVVLSSAEVLRIVKDDLEGNGETFITECRAAPILGALVRGFIGDVRMTPVYSDHVLTDKFATHAAAVYEPAIKLFNPEQ